VAGIYEQEVDSDSAHEMLQQKVLERQQQVQAAELAKQQAKEQEVLAKQQTKEQERLAREQQKEAERTAKQREKLTQDIVDTFAKSAACSLSGSTGQKIVRGLLGFPSSSVNNPPFSDRKHHFYGIFLYPITFLWFYAFPIL